MTTIIMSRVTAMMLMTIVCSGMLVYGSNHHDHHYHQHQHHDDTHVNNRVEGFLLDTTFTDDGVNHHLHNLHDDVVAPSAPRRKLITRYEDIATELRKSSSGGGGATHFDIEASMSSEEVDDATATPSGGAAKKNTVMLHLTKLPSTITTDTEFIFHPSREFDRDMVKDLAILASDPDAYDAHHVHDDDDDSGSGGFTILSVNLKSGDTRGLQRKKGGQIRQFLSSPKQSHDDNESDATATTTTASSTLHGRMMVEQQSGRKFSCGVDHAHSTPHGRGGNTTTTGTTSSSLRSSTIPQAQALATPLASDSTTFVINLVVAVDADFLTMQGGTGPAVEYVNWLISATNAILESEVGARLKVVKVQETDIFNRVTTLDDGLETMRKQFAGTIGGNKNLVHALLGKHIGGGIAYVDTVCDSDWGYGLSSGIQGSMSNLDSDAFQDAFMVAHEIGHSLGSGHTFDGYDPPVDTCGVTCPSRLPLDDSATVMSYCNFCNGGLNNIAMTFGGKWNGVGPKIDLDSWTLNPNLVSSTVSKDARRVSKLIWKTLASRGQCIVAPDPKSEAPTSAPISSAPTSSAPTSSAPPSSAPTSSAPSSSAPTPILTAQPTKSKPTKVPSSLPTKFKQTKVPSPPPSPKPTNTPSASPSSKQPTKAPTFFPLTPQDGRIWYQPNVHCMETLDCATAPGVMFDIALLTKQSVDGIIVDSFQFEHIRSNATVDVYTIEWPSQDVDQDSRAWTKVATVSVDPSRSFTKIIFDYPVTIFPGGVQGFYLTNLVRENFLLVGPADPSALPYYDTNGVAMLDGSVRFGTFGVKIPGYNPTIQAGYSVVLQSKTTSNNLTSSSLTITPKSYTLGPDNLCKEDCFAAPGFMFNVRNTNAATSDISINRISFQHLAPKQQGAVELYRIIGGSYSGNEQNPSKWVKIATTNVPQKYFNTMEFVLGQPITLARGEIVAFYIKTEENILLVRPKQEGENPIANNVQLLYGSSIMNGSFGIPVSGYSWNGAVTFIAN